MSTVTLYLNQSLDYEFGKSAYTPPNNFYIGLSLSLPQPDGSGVVEPGDASYSRFAFANNKTNWTNADEGQISNILEIEFGPSSESWGNILAVIFMDQPTGGNLWYYYPLNPTIFVGPNSTIEFPQGAVTIIKTSSNY